MTRDRCDIRDVVEGGEAVCTGGKRMGVWMEHGGGARLGVDKGMDRSRRGARLGVDG